jgi:hypothetical protein
MIVELEAVCKFYKTDLYSSRDHNKEQPRAYSGEVSLKPDDIHFTDPIVSRTPYNLLIGCDSGC